MIATVADRNVLVRGSIVATGGKVAILMASDLGRIGDATYFR
jgi:hypothetical protein